MSLHIDQIRTDGGTQSRAAINPDTVAEYAEAMADPATVFPPVIVYHDGREYWLADGFHRLAAWREMGRTDIPTEIRQGDQRRAILHSCGANAVHGLRRTNADKRRAVMTLLEDDEWSKWSDSEIARRCGVSRPLVADCRASVTVNSACEPRTYTTKHGTEAQMDTSRIGKRDEIGATPDAVPEAATAPDPVRKPSDTSGADKAGTSAGKPPADGPAPDPWRKGLSGLTREGIEDEVAGLREQCAELRRDLQAVTVERDKLKAQVAELSATNQGAVISSLQREIGAAKYKRDEAMRAAKRMEYRMKQAQKEAEIRL